jgi:CheY-like chemotaxis protein
MKNPNRILISEDTDEWQDIFSDLFRNHEYEIVQAKNIETTLAALEKFHFNVVIVDLSLDPLDESRLDGLETMKRIKTLGAGTQAIVLTGRGTIQLAVDILREYRVFHFLEKEKFEEDRFFKLLGDASVEAANRLLSPGCLPPVEAFIGQAKWDKFAVLLQASSENVQRMFRVLLRSCMPLSLPLATLVTPIVDINNRTIVATVWSKLLGRLVKITVGKRDWSSMPAINDSVERIEHDNIIGCVVAVEPFHSD